MHRKANDTLCGNHTAKNCDQKTGIEWTVDCKLIFYRLLNRSIREFVYFLCGLSPPKRRVVRWRNFEHRRVYIPRAVRDICWVLCLYESSLRKKWHFSINYLHVGLGQQRRSQRAYKAGRNSLYVILYLTPEIGDRLNVWSLKGDPPTIHTPNTNRLLKHPDK